MGNNNNQLAQYNAYVAKYQTEDGKLINLDFSVVRQVLAIGNNILDSEIYNFIKLCEYQRLNPYLKEVHLIKWGKVAQIVVGKDVFTKRLDAHPLCQGWKAGLLLEKDGEIIDRKGAFYLKGKEKIVGAWFEVHRKGWKEPFYWSVPFHEYYREVWDKDSNSYKPMGNWGSMPSSMIIKCAITSGTRNAFPQNFGGMYGEEEMGIDTAAATEKVDITVIDDIEKDDKKVIPGNTIEYINPGQKGILYVKAKGNIEKLKIDTHKLIKKVIENMIQDNLLPSGTKIDTIPKEKCNAVIKEIEEEVAKKEKAYKRKLILDAANNNNKIAKEVIEEMTKTNLLPKSGVYNVGAEVFKKVLDKIKEKVTEIEKAETEEAKELFETEESKKENAPETEETEESININIDEIPLNELDAETKESEDKK